MTGDGDPTGGPGGEPAAAPEPAPGPPARRRRWVAGLVATVVVLGAGAGVVAYQASSSGGGAAPPDALVERSNAPAPSLALPELRAPGRTVTLASLRGKPLVINFWASWCFPCQTEMPLLDAASRAAAGSIRFLGVDTDDTRAAAIAFLRAHHVSYPSLYLADGTGAVGVAFGLIGLPITVFISPTAPCGGGT